MHIVRHHQEANTLLWLLVNQRHHLPLQSWALLVHWLHHVFLYTTPMPFLLPETLHTHFPLSLVCHNSLWSASFRYWLAHSECLSRIYSLCFNQSDKSMLSKLECSPYYWIFTFCRTETLSFKQVSISKTFYFYFKLNFIFSVSS